MTFAARTAAEIRDAALRDLRVRYLALGRDIDIQEGSDAYNHFDALAMAIEPSELGAREAANRVLLRYQYGTDLDESATDEGTTRLPASGARRVVRVLGPASSTVATNGATLGAPSGQRFAPVDPATGAALTAITTDGSGFADVTVECAAVGVTGNLPLGTVLTWDSSPLGFSPLGTIVSGAGAIDGEDAEGDSALRDRIRATRRSRPGSGNPRDWVTWAEECGGVGAAFFHRATLPPAPPVRPAFTIARPGCATVIVVTPPHAVDSYIQNADGSLGAGLLPSYSRRPTQALCDRVSGFIEGTHDSEGNPVPSAAQRQLYPGVIHRENWGVPRPGRFPVDVTVAVRTAGGITDFGFDGTRTVTAAADASHLTLNSVSDISNGSGLAFYFTVADAAGDSTVIRGFWAVGVVASVLGGNNVVLAAPLPAVPPPGTVVRGDPGPVNGAKLWRPLSGAIMRIIDALEPGDPDGLGQSHRFPSAIGADAAIVPSRFLVAALGVPGVIDAEIVTPTVVGPLGLGVVAVPGVITIQRKPF